MHKFLKGKFAKSICLLLVSIIALMALNIDTTVNAQPSPHTYDLSRNFISYYKDSDGNYYYSDYMFGKKSLGPDPTGVIINELFLTPIDVPNYKSVTEEMDYWYGWRPSGRSDSLLNRPPLTEFDRFYVGSSMISATVKQPDGRIMPVLRVQLRGPQYAKLQPDGSYHEYFGLVYVFTDDLYIEDPIRWEYFRMC